MARMAQNATAVALVVVNNEPGSFSMRGTAEDAGKGIKFPVLLIGKEDGAFCLEHGASGGAGVRFSVDLKRGTQEHNLFQSA